jgi:hypothetical protein
MEPLQCISGGEVVSYFCDSPTNEQELVSDHIGDTLAFHAFVAPMLASRKSRVFDITRFESF